MLGIKRSHLRFSSAGLTAPHINIRSLSDLPSKILGNMSLLYL